MLYALLALLVCCVGGTLLGRRLDARDARLADEDAFDGLEATLSDDKATGRFEDLLRPSLARAATGLRVQHPFVNFWCVYSPGVPRSARAWVCGFEILAFLFGAAVQMNLVRTRRPFYVVSAPSTRLLDVVCSMRAGDAVSARWTSTPSTRRPLSTHWFTHAGVPRPRRELRPPLFVDRSALPLAPEPVPLRL